MGRSVFCIIICVLSLSCSKPQEKVLYHCPMHPTYVSESKGDCPICKMSLVPVKPEEKKDEKGGKHHHSGKWTCPMKECQVITDHPGHCPKCGMELVPLEDEGAQTTESQPSFEISTKMDINTTMAKKGALSKKISAVGVVLMDESRMYKVTVKFSGYIERLYANKTGIKISKGQPLMDVYSPEILATQEEFVRSLESYKALSKSSIEDVRKGGEEILDAVKRRLMLFDVPKAMLERIEKTGKVERTVRVSSPYSGTIITKHVVQGQRIEPEMVIFEIGDLSHIWVEADVYENEASLIKVGQMALVSLPHDPQTRLEGRAIFISPTIKPETRTIRVRFEFPNTDENLRPNAFVNVELITETKDGIIIPESSVVYTGTQEVVFVRKGAGRFLLQRVITGLRSEGRVLILEGLKEGEEVAESANFLLDSEAKIRAHIKGVQDDQHHH